MRPSREEASAVALFGLCRVTTPHAQYFNTAISHRKLIS